jgi:hypothetical protein
VAPKMSPWHERLSTPRSTTRSSAESRNIYQVRTRIHSCCASSSPAMHHGVVVVVLRRHMEGASASGDRKQAPPRPPQR